MLNAWIIAVGLFLVAAPEEPEPRGVDVAVLPYQTLRIPAPFVEATVETLRERALARGLKLLSRDEERKLARSAVMCGEDEPCLALLGQKAQAKWVLGLGLAKAGKTLLVTAQRVNVANATQETATSMQFVFGRATAQEVGARLGDSLLPQPPA